MIIPHLGVSGEVVLGVLVSFGVSAPRDAHVVRDAMWAIRRPETLDPSFLSPRSPRFVTSSETRGSTTALFLRRIVAAVIARALPAAALRCSSLTPGSNSDHGALPRRPTPRGGNRQGIGSHNTFWRCTRGVDQ